MKHVLLLILSRFLWSRFYACQTASVSVLFQAVSGMLVFPFSSEIIDLTLNKYNSVNRQILKKMFALETDIKIPTKFLKS